MYRRNLARLFSTARRASRGAKVVLLCWCAGLLPALALPTEPLAGDARLAQTVDLAVKEMPLAELLPRVAQETGVALRASEDTADERVTLFVRGRPAREVLARLAEHLDYTWVRETRDGVPSFVLIQDQAAKQRQAAWGGGADADAAALRDSLEAQVRLLESSAGRAATRKPHVQRIVRIRELDERLLGVRYVIHAPDGAFSTERRQPAPLLPRERQTLERELELLRRTTLGQSGGFDGEDCAAWLYALLPPSGPSHF